MSTSRLAQLAAVAALAAFSLASAPARAVPITYEGTLALPATVTGSVGGNGWESETAAEVDFWRFSGRAGDFLTVVGMRLVQGLDPVFTLYFGSTTADASQFLHDADWGGLTYLALADDERAVASGPGGDPALTSFLLPITGNYTIAIGGISSAGAGPFGYQLQVTAVPEPEVVLLYGAGLGALAALRRRKRVTDPA